MKTFALACFLVFLFQICHAAVPNYVVEVYYVVERRVLDEYISEAGGNAVTGDRNLKADIEYFLTEVNQIYADSSKTHGRFNIQIVVRRIDILDYNVYQTSTINVNQVSRPGDNDGFQIFWQWLENQGSYDWINYDIALLWTGSDIIGDGAQSTVGIAPNYAMCQHGSRSAAIVEMDRHFHTVEVIAHEIGHTLGADHDAPDNGYAMMTNSLADSPNRWEFSLQTWNSFGDFINTLTTNGQNCLLTTDPSSRLPNADVTPELADANTVCARAHDSTQSYMCLNPALYNNEEARGDIVCRKLMCSCPGDTCPWKLDPKDPFVCGPVYSSDGLICEKGRRCSNGKCVHDPSTEASAVDSNCLWGDQKRVKIPVSSETFKGTCADFLAEHGVGQCYGKSIYRSCCKSCKEAKTGDESCPWGDHLNFTRTTETGSVYTNCTEYLEEKGIGECEIEAVRKQCCQTCAEAENEEATCQYPSDVKVFPVNTYYGTRDYTCSEYLYEFGTGDCNTDWVHERCCNHCEDLKLEDESCPWGDVNYVSFQNYDYTCYEFIDYYDIDWCYENSDFRDNLCCKTCQDVFSWYNGKRKRSAPTGTIFHNTPVDPQLSPAPEVEEQTNKVVPEENQPIDR